MLTKSNYRISYFPRNATSGHSVLINLKKEFCDFARTQKVNREKYVELGASLIEVLCQSDFNKDNGLVLANHFKENSQSIIWDGGLVRVLQVPGNAAGINLEESHIDGPLYSPNNMDGVNQAAMVLAFFTHYFYDLESRIK